VISSIVASQASSPESTSNSFKAATTPSINVVDSTEQTKTPNHKSVIISSIVGALLLVSLGIAIRYYFKRRWKRRLEGSRIPAPSRSNSTQTIASFVAGYSTEVGHEYRAIPDYTYYVPPTPALVRSISPGLTLSTSFPSIPPSLYEPSSADTYSPAAPSSDMYTMNLDHSPLTPSTHRARTEDMVAIQKRWKLLPLRRKEDLVDIQKRWKLFPLRRKEEA